MKITTEYGVKRPPVYDSTIILTVHEGEAVELAKTLSEHTGQPFTPIQRTVTYADWEDYQPTKTVAVPVEPLIPFEVRLQIRLDAMEQEAIARINRLVQEGQNKQSLAMHDYEVQVTQRAYQVNLAARVAARNKKIKKNPKRRYQPIREIYADAYSSRQCAYAGHAPGV